MPFRSPHPEIRIPDLSLTQFVLGGDDGRDRPALVDGVTGRALTYGDLRAQVRRLAAGLATRLGKGDVVAIWAPNCLEYAVVFHAVVGQGAILTTINPAYTNHEVAAQLRDATACVLVTTAALAERAREAVAAAAMTIDLITSDAAPGLPSLASIAMDAGPPAATIDPDDIAVLPYSSGTTGLSKGVMLTHRNLVANVAQIEAIEWRDLSTFIAVLPFFHIYGMTAILNLGLRRRFTIVTLTRFDLEQFLSVLQQWPIALAHIVPPIAVALAKHPVVDRFDLRNVKCFFSGAAPFGAELTQALRVRLKVATRQGYGMTETSPAAYYAPPGLERDGTVGLLVANTEARLVSPESGTDAAPGEPGEVWIRGPQVMKGYWNNPEATAATLDADGWLRTGDIGTLDADGFLTVVDRLKELTRSRGSRWRPRSSSRSCSSTRRLPTPP